MFSRASSRLRTIRLQNLFFHARHASRFHYLFFPFSVRKWIVCPRIAGNRGYLEAFRDGGERLRDAGVIKLTTTRDIMKFLAWDRAQRIAYYLWTNSLVRWCALFPWKKFISWPRYEIRRKFINDMEHWASMLIRRIRNWSALRFESSRSRVITYRPVNG